MPWALQWTAGLHLLGLLAECWSAATLLAGRLRVNGARVIAKWG